MFVSLQGGMQPPVYMPNGYMMTYYPAVPSGNMPMYGMENGGQGKINCVNNSGS